MQKFREALVLTLIAPVFGLIYAIKAKRVKYRYGLLLLFTAFYGFTIYIDPALDGFRARETAITYYTDMSLPDFITLTKQIITLSSPSWAYNDLYVHFLAFFLIKLLGAPILYFPVVALVYGYFYFGTLLEVRKSVVGKATYIFWLFFISLLTWKSLEGMVTVRTYTGMWMLLYGYLKFQRTRKKRYLIFVALPPFVHFGFFVMAIPAYVALLIGPRRILFSLLFAVALILPNQGNVLSSAIQQTELGAQKSRSYDVSTGSEIALDIASKQNAEGKIFVAGYVRVQNHVFVLKWFLMIFLLLPHYRKNMLKAEASIFSAGLLGFALADLMNSVIAINQRLNLVSSVFVLAAMALYFGRTTVEQKRNILAGQNLPYLLLFVGLTPLFVYFILSNLVFLDFYMLLLPYVHFLGDDVGITIREVIRLFLF